jgi:nucleotide-binding universal stress UspA family protein
VYLWFAARLGVDCSIGPLAALMSGVGESMFEKILVPVDFSEHSALAFGHASAFARAFGGRIELLHVVEQVVHAHPSFWSAEPALADELHQQSVAVAETKLSELLAAHGELGPNAVGRVLSGSLPGALADRASEAAVDLIITPTHGRTGFARWLMGSVSERLLRVAPCSVLVVRARPSAAEPMIRRVLVALDLSEHCRPALEAAARIAGAFAASLEALHVIAVPAHAGADGAALVGRMRDSARAELEAFLGKSTLPAGVEVLRTVVSGTPTAAISERVAEVLPDLLVLGTHGYGGVKRLVLGSVAEATARYAGCTTLVVR